MRNSERFHSGRNEQMTMNEDEFEGKSGKIVKKIKMEKMRWKGVGVKK